MRLIYFRQPDDLPAAGPAFGLDDDGDSWWAGSQRCFSTVPLAVALAAVALSASLAFGYQQQTEDIIPTPPTVEEDYWQVYTPPYPRPGCLYLPDAEEIPAGSLFGPPEEDAFWFPSRGIVRYITTAFTGDDSVVVSSPPDEEFWRVYTPPPYPPLHFLYLPDPEEIPAGALFGVPEEEYWQVSTPLSVPAIIPSPSWDDQLPAGSLISVTLGPSRSTSVATVQVSYSAELASAARFTVEEA